MAEGFMKDLLPFFMSNSISVNSGLFMYGILTGRKLHYLINETMI